MPVDMIDAFHIERVPGLNTKSSPPGLCFMTAKIIPAVGKINAFLCMGGASPSHAGCNLACGRQPMAMEIFSNRGYEKEDENDG